MSSAGSRGERVIELVLQVCGLSAIGFVLAILVFIGSEGLPFLMRHAGDLFGSTEWDPTGTPSSWGALALVAGTVWVVGLSLLVSVPIGLGAGVWLSEYAPPSLRETLKVVIELLAAVPSVVWGFVGVVIVNPWLQALGAPIGLNGLNGALLLAMMTLPLLVSLGEDALRAVPPSYREAAMALGATRWEMVRLVLLPAARRGLLVAVLLGVGRCVGETMAVLMATGHAVRVPTHLFDPVRTVTATIAAELGEAEQGGEHWQALFALGLVLFAITFVINALADRLVRAAR